MTVSVFRVIDEPQGVSAFAFSDLLQQLDLLWIFVTSAVCLSKVLLVNEFDCNFASSFLMLRQNHLAKGTFAEHFKLDVREEQVALARCVLMDLQKAVVQVLVTVEEYLTFYLPNQCKNESLAGLLTFFSICGRTLLFGSKKALEFLKWIHKQRLLGTLGTEHTQAASL